MSTATIVEHKKGICVEFGETNNNKFWEYTVYDDGTAMTAWGRVGVTRTERATPIAKAHKKWAEKTNPNNAPDKFYTEVKAVDTGGTSKTVGASVKNAELKDIARKQIKHTDPVVQKLIDYLISANAHQIMKQSGGKIVYDASSATFKTPLGVIDPSQVSDARDLLVDISDFVKKSDFSNKKFSKILNSYLRLIPHDVGMTKITPKLIFPNTSTVIAENDLLDGLETSFIDVTTAPNKTKKKAPKKVAPKVFDVSMSIVKDKKILSHVKHLYQSTRKSMHQSNNLSVQSVYKVEISSMKKAFEKYGASLPDIRQLWHGTKASNLLSIMRQGLVIPSSNSGHVTGRMYGDGVYFSCISTKALNYATSYWGGGGSTDRTFMFLADVAMGKYYLAKSSWDDYPKRGYDSTWAKGGVAGVINDEMIVYQLNQCNLVYLVEFVPRNQYRG
jgi:poly [ADP-ribose] polymerase